MPSCPKKTCRRTSCTSSSSMPSCRASWPSITKRKPAPPDADEWKDKKDKLSELIR